MPPDFERKAQTLRDKLLMWRFDVLAPDMTVPEVRTGIRPTN